MTAIGAAHRTTSATAARPGLRAWLGAVAILAALAAIVGSRWLATVRGLDGLAIGAGFGLALGALWLTAHRLTGLRAPTAPKARAAGPTGRRTSRALVIGTAFGLALVAGAAVGAQIGELALVPGPGRPAAPFVPWAVITILVATAEEGILRGVLFDRLRASGGTVLAIAVTTIAFALMHVPLYGWHVVPLDLGVGLAFAGIRLSTRSIVAPAAAHAVADLASWWL